MEENSDEEHRVEIRDDSGSTNDSTPCQTHDPVSDIVWLARVSPPAASEETVTGRRNQSQRKVESKGFLPMCSLDKGRVFDYATR